MEAANGYLLFEPVQGQNTKYLPMVISENIEEELHRRVASSDTIDNLKEDDGMTHLPIRSMSLDGSIRPYALRCISHLLRAKTSDEGIWFHAALLLDRFAASNSFHLEAAADLRVLSEPCLEVRIREALCRPELPLDDLDQGLCRVVGVHTELRDF